MHEKRILVVGVGVGLILLVGAVRTGDRVPDTSSSMPSVPIISETETLTYPTPDGLRYYKRYVPSGGATGRPVILYLHGGGQSFGVLDNTAVGTALKAIAEEERVVLLVPNGTDLDSGSFYDPEDERGGIRNRQRWNDDRLEDQPLVEAVDDVWFLSGLVDYTQDELATDPSRVYVLGPSNGGYMTQKLLLETSERFAAGASVIATVPVNHLGRQAEVPTPILLWIGSEDPLVAYEGSAAGLSGADSIQWWAEHNGHTGTRDMVRITDPDEAGCYTTVQAFEGEFPVYGYVSHGGGHILPSVQNRISGGFTVDRFIGHQCGDIEGVTIIWDFLSRFERTDM